MKASLTKAPLIIFLIFALVVSSTPLANTTYAMGDESTDMEFTNTEDKLGTVNATIQKEDAIQIVKEKLNFSDEYQLKSVSFNNNWGYQKQSAWNLYWTLEKDGNNTSNLNVTIDSEKGTILSVSYYNNKNTEVPSFPAKVSIKEAVTIADIFIKDFYPEIFSKIQLDESYVTNYKAPLNQPIYYSIPYRHMINDIPFVDKTINVYVNGNGEVSSFYYSYLDDNILFEDIDEPISLNEALAKFTDNLAINLSYVFPYGQYNQSKTPYLAYSAANLQPIDAKTGEPYYYPSQSKVNLTYEPIVPEPIAEPIVVNEKELTQEQVLKLADDYLKFFNLKLPQINSINYDSNHYLAKHGVWNLSWYNDGSKEKYFYVNMSIDALTGELLNYYSNDNNFNENEDSEESKLSYNAAKELAINAIKKLAPAKAHQVYLYEGISEEELVKQNTIYFNFTRLVNDVPVEGESIQINLNLLNGKIFNFSSYWSDTKFSNGLPETITKEAATQLILEDFILELVYIAPYKPYEDGNKTRNSVLVYLPKKAGTDYPSTFLDATLGEWRSRQDGSLLQNANPTDIAGHWAEKELKLMVDYRAIEVTDGKVKPEDKITRGELIKMFIIAANGGNYYPYYDMKEATFADVSQDSPYFSYVEEAVRKNIISVSESKVFNPDQQVTREELAQLIVKALGYDKLAQTEGLFTNTFRDLKESKYSGHISIVSALKIMNGDGDSFNPEKKVTKAVASVSFYRFLEARNKLQESKQPIYY